MDNVSSRITALSPEKRKLLDALREGRIQISERQSRARAKNAEPDRLVIEAGSTETEMKENYRRFYNSVSAQLDSSEFGELSFFLNYGYVADHNPQSSSVELPTYFLNKNSVKLVLELIGDCALTDRCVLDVGCGRGGTVYAINHFFAPARTTGVDLSSVAIAFCRRTHRYRNVSFLEGDAERLPFKDEAFDVVTNVESSHSYPNIQAFYEGVFRVLKPGGCFLYTDVMPVEAMSSCTALLMGTGFVVERDRDITTNVVLSCDEIARTRLQAFDQNNDRNLMHDFLAVPGSAIYDNMRAGSCTYRIFRLRKR